MISLDNYIGRCRYEAVKLNMANTPVADSILQVVIYCLQLAYLPYSDLQRVATVHRLIAAGWTERLTDC